MSAKKTVDKINLGCGRDIKKGYLNVDIKKAKSVDGVVNLNKVPYPFKEGQFREVYMRNILEHLDNPYGIMKEIHRISANRAKILIRVPHFSSNNVWGDLQHRRGFNTDTFINENMSNLFQVIRQEITFSNIRFFMRWLAKLNPKFYEKNLAYIFPAIDLIVELRVKK